jgi:hypothetical protein
MSELKIPKKGISIHELYNNSYISIPKVSPKELNTMGVGYKDKGSMSTVEVVELPEDISLFDPGFLDRKKLQEYLSFFDKNFSK